MRVRVYLRQALFTVPGAPHLPAQAAILEGHTDELNLDGLRLQVEAWSDEKGRTLEGAGADLVLPAAKIDHVIVLS